MKSEKKFLELLLTNWAWCKAQPKLCKMQLLAHRTFKDTLAADIIQCLIIHDGDWRAAARWLIDHGRDSRRIATFLEWATKVTQPKKRGLLIAWNGGKS